MTSCQLSLLYVLYSHCLHNWNIYLPKKTRYANIAAADDDENDS